MAVGTRHADSDPGAETNPYLEPTWLMGTSLIPASMQRIDFDLMAVSQQTEWTKVVTEQLTNTCPRPISAQQIDSGLMAML